MWPKPWKFKAEWDVLKSQWKKHKDVKITWVEASGELELDWVSGDCSVSDRGDWERARLLQ